MNSLISIIIPTYNRANLITYTLNSIADQTYTNWECIIVDDGSTDSTCEILKKYCNDDLRFKYYSRPLDKRKGANSCRNYGFELSKGEFIKWFDSDDIMHPDFLKKQLEILYNNLELDFSASFSQTFDERMDKVVGYNNPKIYVNDQDTLFNYIIGKLIFLTPSPLWRRDFLENKSLFDESLFNAHETDFNFARLIEGARFKYLTEILFFVRRGHQSIDKDSIKDINSYLSIFKYYQKVFSYIRTRRSISNVEEKEILSKFILYKQLMILNNLRQIFPATYYLKEIKIVVGNTFKIKVQFKYYVKILIGILLLVFFKKGYRFLSLEELKKANNYK